MSGCGVSPVIHKKLGLNVRLEIVLFFCTRRLIGWNY